MTMEVSPGRFSQCYYFFGDGASRISSHQMPSMGTEAGRTLCFIAQAPSLLNWFLAEQQNEHERGACGALTLEVRAPHPTPHPSLNLLQPGFGPQFGRRQVLNFGSRQRHLLCSFLLDCGGGCSFYL